MAAGSRARSLAGSRRVRLLAVVLAGAAFLLLGWQAVTTAGRSMPLDAGEYVLNAQYLDDHGWIPPVYVSYEYSAPPLFEFVAVGAEHAVRALPSLPLELPSNLATRLLWLALVLASAAAITSSRQTWRRLGIAGVVLAALWGLDEALSLGRSERWSAGQLLSLGAALGLVLVSALIAREVWPGHPGRALATAGFVMAYPAVLRLGALFHPETTTALFAVLAVLAVVRAERRGWPVGLGLATGIACGLGLLTRQSALVVFVCALATALWIGRRKAVRFAVATAGAALLLAGPWLGYAAYTWGNPFQGNLERPGGMVQGGEPLSFFVSAPVGSLVLHPYRERFVNELLPQLHADLWSDWFGAFHHNWSNPTTLDRVTASSQSIFGFVGDALAIGGLAVFGIPAVIRLIRHRRAGDSDPALALLSLVAVVGFVALVAQILRYPQLGGKEIKASYLLFAAPGFAIFSVASWLALARRRSWIGPTLTAVAALYLVSYGTHLASALGQRYAPHADLAPRYGFYDLRMVVPPVSGTLPIGKEQDVDLSVANAGTGTALGVRVTIQLSPGMKLNGPPYTERGSGCTGTTTIVCDLDFLEPGMTTPVRFAVKLTGLGVTTLTASVDSAFGADAHPADNSGSVTFRVVIPPPGTGG
jgi:Domain of unknown function DUF11/Dolichyl-phosphate-mannose-protein mannosyltransferase